jgi:hypothetical protein
MNTAILKLAFLQSTGASLILESTFFQSFGAPLVLKSALSSEQTFLFEGKEEFNG